MLDDILFLNPVCTHNIWGGTRLRQQFGYEVEGNDVGECWGISAHPNGDGTIKEGALSGMKLSEAWEKYPELFGNLSYDRFPLMVKIIDAKDDLSIQVHPDDEYAKVHENGSFGKTECWYVLDCPKNGALVIGHNASSKEELEEMIHEKRWSEFIREIPVKKGDFIQIDPGCVHAIKGGLLILETQQNSDITYRVYDYDRLQNGKPRDLHVKQSIDVITVPAKSVEESVISIDHNAEKNRLNHLFTSKFYTIFHMDVEGKTTIEQKYPFLNVSILEGEGKINGHSIKKGDHMILTSLCKEAMLEGNLEVMASTAL